MKKKIYLLLALVMTVMTAGAADVPTYSLTKATGADAHGTVSFKVDNTDNASTAAEGKTVTITVTPNTGFVVDTVKGAWNATIAASRRLRADNDPIETLDSIDIEFVSEVNGVKTYTFTMMRAEAIISVQYKKLMTNQDISISIAEITYSGEALEPEVTVKDGDNTLVLDTDFTVEYTNNINARSADADNAPTMTITGIGENYSGEVTKTFTIERKEGTVSFSGGNVTKNSNSSSFTKTATVEGDGTVSYSSSNRLVGDVDAVTGRVNIWSTGSAIITATVTEAENGNYTYPENTASYTLTVTKPSISVTAKGYSGTYDRQPHTITVTASSGATIVYGTTPGTYDLEEPPTFTEAGTYTVYYKVTKSNYATTTGSKTVVISPAKITEVTLEKTQLVYTGQEQTVVPTSVKAGELTLTADDYDVTGNVQTEIGKYTLTVNGKGNFTGTKTAAFEIMESTAYSETMLALEQLKAENDAVAEAIADMELTDTAKASLVANKAAIDAMIAALEEQLENDRMNGTLEENKADYEQQLAQIQAAIDAFRERIADFPMMGDANGDLMVDVDDYVIMGQMILGTRPMATGDLLLNLDLTSDGSLGVGDLTGELNLWMGRKWNDSGAAAE